MSAARERDQVAALSPRDSPAALLRARQIEDPWSRAQALAWVARFAPDEDVARIVDESLAAGRQGEDAYRSVAVGAWPVRALIERGLLEAARLQLTAHRARCPSVEPPSSRAEALSLLYQAAFALGSDVRETLTMDLVALHDADPHWRTARCLLDAIQMHAAADPGAAAAIASGLGDEALRRKALKRIDAGTPLEPRPFFWRAQGDDPL